MTILTIPLEFFLFALTLLGVALFHHRTLHEWHLDAALRPSEDVSRSPAAYTSFHDGAWWLVNITDRSWVTSTGAVVARNTPVQLIDGLELAVTEGAGGSPGRTWRVQMRQG